MYGKSIPYYGISDVEVCVASNICATAVIGIHYFGRNGGRITSDNNNSPTKLFMSAFLPCREALGKD
jgi:hypothetical protein